MMMMPKLLALLCLLQISTGALADDGKTKSNTSAEEYKALLDEYEEVGGAKQFAPRFFDLAEKHPKDPVAVDALVWILTKRRSQPEATRALELLGTHHLNSPALEPACRSIARVPATAAETLLRRVLEKSTHAAVRGQACYYLAYLLERQSSVVDQLKANPDLTERVLQYYGKEYGKHLMRLDHAKLNGKLEKVYALMAKSYADVQVGDENIGDFALAALFRIRNLSQGRVAAEITGEDIFGKEFKLSDYRGKVVLLTFWGHW
jgi:hypothetical protein